MANNLIITPLNLKKCVHDEKKLSLNLKYFKVCSSFAMKSTCCLGSLKEKHKDIHSTKSFILKTKLIAQFCKVYTTLTSKPSLVLKALELLFNACVKTDGKGIGFRHY